MLQIHSSLEKAHDEWMETFEHNCKFVPHNLWKTDLFFLLFFKNFFKCIMIQCYSELPYTLSCGCMLRHAVWEESSHFSCHINSLTFDYLVYRRVHAPLTDCKLSLIIVLYEPGVNVLHFCEDRDIVLAHIWMLQCRKLAKVQLFWRCTHSLMIS